MPGVQTQVVRVEFVVDKVAEGGLFSEYFDFPLNIIPPVLHTDLSTTDNLSN
jgi:hypothetical protein